MMELLIFALGVSIAFNAKTESISPIVVEPESPMKIAAGEKLKNKNANNEPARENESKDITISSAIKNQIPKIEEAINPIPAARPSTPSIKLNALMVTITAKSEMKILDQ